LDFLIVNQQLPQGWGDEARAAWIRDELRQGWTNRHLVDSRQFVHTFAGAALKLNQHEAARLLQRQDIGPTASFSDDDAIAIASQLARLSDEAQFLTRGENGIIACHSRQATAVPGVQIVGPTDTVGAGDTVTAALAACRAAGVEPLKAATLANLAASITVQKLNQTGTATEPELIAAAQKLAYVYHPTLAQEPRRAKYVEDSDIEVVEDMCDEVPFRYAVFDHDGTISTLRQGWEYVMAPVMLRAILGNQYASVNSELFERIQQRVQHFIEQSTGIQTIAQMDALVEMVNEFDVVPPEQRLDAWGYKRVYNDALMDMVNDRLDRLERSELAPEDFIMKGVVEFLRALRSRDVTLYLVSGTDEADTLREAATLGYADLFNGGIFGARPGSRADTKDEIIQSVLESVQQGAGGGRHHPRLPLLIVGDGPVEIRLGRRYGGRSLGVASHEERRFGLNLVKRRRLIRAGAHTIVPDFSQWRQLIAYLCEPVSSPLRQDSSVPGSRLWPDLPRPATG
jgi:phosphoglycolate phosphatase-like HAD superfamily hydrolase